MHNKIRGLLGFFLLAAVTLLGACVAFDVADREGSCQPGLQCEFHGELHVFPGEPVSTVIVQSRNICVKLALSDDYYGKLSVWDRREVLVRGVAFDQFYDPGLGMTWYRYKDRKLGVGICDYGYGIYVDSIDVDKERRW